MEAEEMFEQWLNGNCEHVINYILKDCKPSKLVDFVMWLVAAHNADCSHGNKLMDMLSRREGN